MVFSVVVNCFNNSFKIVHTAKQASSTNSRYDEMFSWNSSCYQLSGIFTFLVMFLGRRVWLIFFFAKRCLRHVLQLLNKQTKKKPNWSIDRKLVPRGSRLPSLILAVACTFDVILPEIADLFQIWSTLAGYEDFSRGILANQKRRNILNE